MTMPQLWIFLKKNNQLENGDVLDPANLVNIITALAISMQETAPRMNKTRESPARIDNLENQVRPLIEAQRVPTTPNPQHERSPG